MDYRPGDRRLPVRDPHRCGNPDCTDHDAGGHGHRPGAGAADDPAGGQPAFIADAEQSLLRQSAVPDRIAGGVVRDRDGSGGDGVGVSHSDVEKRMAIFKVKIRACYRR